MRDFRNFTFRQVFLKLQNIFQNQKQFENKNLSSESSGISLTAVYQFDFRVGNKINSIG